MNWCIVLAMSKDRNFELSPFYTGLVVGLISLTAAVVAEAANVDGANEGASLAWQVGLLLVVLLGLSPLIRHS